MKRWVAQLGFGLAVGLAVWVLLPGYHPGGLAPTGLWSLVGAAGGGAVAEVLLPGELLRQGGLVLAGLGSIAALLVQAVVSG